ncbi:MAG: EAL domain-containing protein [Rhodoferax sp.]
MSSSTQNGIEPINPDDPDFGFCPVSHLQSGEVHAHWAQTFDASKPSVSASLDALAPLLRKWGQWRARGRLMVSLRADAIDQGAQRLGHAKALLRWLHRWGLLARQITVVLELSDSSLHNNQAVEQGIALLRQSGLGVALRDNGQGWPSLRQWAQLRPDILVLDPYFGHGIAQDANRVEALRALLQMGQPLKTELLVCAVREQADLRLLRDLGLPLAVGPYIGTLQPVPCASLAPHAQAVLTSRQIAVPPLGRAGSGASVSVFDRLSIIRSPTLAPQANCDAVFDLFQRNPQLHALPVVDGDRPVALIGRMNFLTQYSKRYYRDLFARKPCTEFANPEPRLIEVRHRIDELLGILTSDDQRYLNEGFIVVENGAYRGLCRGDQIVKSVTEMRIEAARHANPLTFLPGNIPITEHIERLLARGSDFVVCYLDLNHFKSFNDRYGYWRGDEMIRLVAQVAKAHTQPQTDFLGHVGGDDFVIVFQDAEWDVQCRHMIEEFNARAITLFDPADQQAGGIRAEDRQGVPRFFPFTSLSIGAVLVQAGQFRSAEDVANAAASAKHAAKQSTRGLARYNAEPLTQVALRTAGQCAPGRADPFQADASQLAGDGPPA